MGAYDALRRLNGLRKKIFVYEWIPLGFLLGGFMLQLLGDIHEFWLIGLIGAIVTAIIFGTQVPFLRKEYRELYKTTFVSPILKTMLDDVEYDWHMGFTEIEVMSFGIVRVGNCFQSEDYVSGSYRGVKFRQADVVIKHRTGSGSNTKIQTYFSGRMFEFEYPSKAVANVKVFSKNYNSRLNLKGDEVELEDVNFNRKFDVYSSSEHEAFYILTPPMMERMQDLNNRLGTMACRFAPGKLYVGICTEDSFDTGICRKLSYPEERERMKKDVQVIIDMIEIINLIQDRN